MEHPKNKIKTEVVGIRLTPLEKRSIQFGMEVAECKSMSEFFRKSGLSVARDCALEMLSRSPDSLAG